MPKPGVGKKESIKPKVKPIRRNKRIETYAVHSLESEDVEPVEAVETF